jgi:hypothetical protein
MPQFAGFPLCVFPREMHGGEQEIVLHVHTQLVPERVRADFCIGKRAGLLERPYAVRG